MLSPPIIRGRDLTNQFTATLLVVPKVHESGIATPSLCVSQKYLARREGKRKLLISLHLLRLLCSSQVFLSLLVARVWEQAYGRTGRCISPRSHPSKRALCHLKVCPKVFHLFYSALWRQQSRPLWQVSLLFEGRAAIALISCRCAQYFILFCLRPKNVESRRLWAVLSHLGLLKANLGMTQEK